MKLRVERLFSHPDISDTDVNLAKNYKYKSFLDLIHWRQALGTMHALLRKKLADVRPSYFYFAREKS
jgi:hypothetical protein